MFRPRITVLMYLYYDINTADAWGIIYTLMGCIECSMIRMVVFIANILYIPYSRIHTYSHHAQAHDY